MKNPLYDPAWQARVRSCAARAEQAKIAVEQSAAADGFASPGHLAAMARQRDMMAALAQATAAQYRTIADYAAWRFGPLQADPARPEIVQDYGAFSTIAEVDTAFGRAQQRAAENAFIDTMSLPVRQPAGLLAFADADAVISSPRRFTAEELGPYAAAGTDAVLDCMVSFQQLGEELHFCIAHRWGNLSAAAGRDGRHAAAGGDQFRTIATLLARQAISHAIPDAALIFAGGRHGLLEHRPLIRAVNQFAARLHMYRHLLPDRDLKERFCRVGLGWDGARFIDPDFSAWLYESIPAVLRAASAPGGGRVDGIKLIEG